MPELGTPDHACTPPRITTTRDYSAAGDLIGRNLRAEAAAGRNGR